MLAESHAEAFDDDEGEDLLLGEDASDGSFATGKRQSWSIEDEYNFDAILSDATRGTVLLVDAHVSMCRPLCDDKALREAIFNEACREAEKEAAAKVAGWRLLAGTTKLDKDDLRSKAAAITAAVLQGVRRPPGRLLRAVDVVAQAAATLAAELGGSELNCALFGDGGAGAAAAGLVTDRISPQQVAAVWDAARGASIAPFSMVCVEALRHAADVVVLSGRPLPAQLLRQVMDESTQAVPLSWVYCSTQEAPGFEEVRTLCASTGGSAQRVESVPQLHAALASALTARGSAVSASCAAAAGAAVAPRLPVLSGAVPLEALVTRVRASSSKVAGLPLPSLVGHGIRKTKASSSTAAPTASGRPPDGGVVEAVLRQHFRELSRLPPDRRRARIRELVAEEVASRHGSGGLELPVSVIVRRVIGKSLDAPRGVDQRLLIEWMLVMNRILSFVGDACALSRATAVCRLWRQALHSSGSQLAKQVWKWTVRFGEEVPAQCRWALWCSLLQRHQAPERRTTVRARSYEARLAAGRDDPALLEARSVIAADVPRTMAAVFGPDDSTSRGGEPSAASPRITPRRSPLRLAEGARSPVRLSACSESQRSLEHVLVAVAAECPAVGYCQGLDVVAAFALSVALEAGLERAAAEAQTFAFVSGLLELEYIQSWLEPPLLGLRAAALALAGMLEQRQPRLADHLRSEGVGVEHLCLPWLQTCFAMLSALPRPTLCRIWECWLLDGSPKVFFRVALSLFAQAEEALLGQPVEDIAETLRTFPAPLDAGLAAGELVARAWATKVTRSRLRPTLATAEAAIISATSHRPASSGETFTPPRRGSGLEPELVLDSGPVQTSPELLILDLLE